MRLVAADESLVELLADRLRDGGSILLPQAGSEPLPLVEALTRVRGLRQRATVYVGHGVNHVVANLPPEDFRIVALAAAGTTARLVSSGRAETMPMQWSQLVHDIVSRRLVLDVALLQVSTEFEGRHSFGVGSDLGSLLASAASTIFAEINAQMPFVTGPEGLVADAVDYAVVTDRALPTATPAAPNEIESAIGRHVATIVPDRATLQVGIGAVPEAVLAALDGHRDLGVHTGLFGDGLMRLVERGVITNAHKGYCPGSSVTGAILGTPDLYKWVDRNPAVTGIGLAHTHGARTLEALDNFTAINSAIEVDLTGQINAENAGGRYIGAVGGQVDFMRAGARSPGGLSVIAMSSRTPRGRAKIVRRLSDGVVSTLRTDLEIVVTEYGIADLRHATLEQRMRRLIEVAHPEDRDELTAVMNN